jgi:predicted DNA-binding protein (UPF0251 family)
MYSMQKAAEILGVSEWTVRARMKRCGMKGVIVDTDRRRVYIADNDMDTLVDHITEKVLKEDNKAGGYDRSDKRVIINGEGKYYSLAGAALLLEVSEFTVKKWSKRDNIERKLITTDRTRAYIAHDDVLRLADLHGCKVSPKVLAEMNIQRAVNATQPDLDKLCSIKEAALYMDISQSTLRTWIIQDSIDKKTKSTDRHRACITYRDVLRLADLHKREVVPEPSPLTVKEEIKEIKGKLKEIVSEIEDIKHDFRLFVKRSIYIG